MPLQGLLWVPPTYCGSTLSNFRYGIEMESTDLIAVSHALDLFNLAMKHIGWLIYQVLQHVSIQRYTPL